MQEAIFQSIFTGALSLSNVLGTSYATHNQSGILNIQASGNKVINGTATIAIVANGQAINIDSSWIKLGDDFSINPGDTNVLIVLWSGQNFYWSNTVKSV